MTRRLSRDPAAIPRGGAVAMVGAEGYQPYSTNLTNFRVTGVLKKDGDVPKMTIPGMTHRTRMNDINYCNNMLGVYSLSWCPALQVHPFFSQ